MPHIPGHVDDMLEGLREALDEGTFAAFQRIMGEGTFAAFQRIMGESLTDEEKRLQGIIGRRGPRPESARSRGLQAVLGEEQELFGGQRPGGRSFEQVFPGIPQGAVIPQGTRENIAGQIGTVPGSNIPIVLEPPGSVAGITDSYNKLVTRELQSPGNYDRQGNLTQAALARLGQLRDERDALTRDLETRQAQEQRDPTITKDQALRLGFPQLEGQPQSFLNIIFPILTGQAQQMAQQNRDQLASQGLLKAFTQIFPDVDISRIKGAQNLTPELLILLFQLLFQQRGQGGGLRNVGRTIFA